MFKILKTHKPVFGCLHFQKRMSTQTGLVLESLGLQDNYCCFTQLLHLSSYENFKRHLVIVHHMIPVRMVYDSSCNHPIFEMVLLFYFIISYRLSSLL